MTAIAHFEAVKAAAAYNAIQESGADVIVAPRYTVQKDDYENVKELKKLAMIKE